MTIEASVARLNRIAWLCAAAAAVFAATRWLQGHPRVPLVDPVPLATVPMAIAALSLGAFAIVVMMPLVVRLAGRSFRRQFVAEREQRIEPLGGRDRLDHILARLLELGWRIESEETLPDGWRVRARRKMTRADFLHDAQSMEILLRGEQLRVRHEMRSGVDCGQEHYQSWFLRALLEDRPVASPPRQLSVGILALSGGATMALAAAAISLLPERMRGSWSTGIALAELVGVCATALGCLTAPIPPRSHGRWLVFPAAVLATTGLVLWLVRPVEWRDRDSHDPAALVRSGCSAYGSATGGVGVESSRMPKIVARNRSIRNCPQMSATLATRSPQRMQLPRLSTSFWQSDLLFAYRYSVQQFGQVAAITKIIPRRRLAGTATTR